ncbi:hypothetical protein HDE_12964 [Halotydeus destructor]|nr:hypothetical protein HDE_12964 [Halotydeus destructor]
MTIVVPDEITVQSNSFVSRTLAPPYSAVVNDGSHASALAIDSEFAAVDVPTAVAQTNSSEISGGSSLLTYSIVVKGQLVILRSALAVLSMRSFRTKLLHYVELMEKLVDNNEKFLSACRLESLFFTRYYTVLLQNSYHGSRAASLINIQKMKGPEEGSRALEVRRRLNVWQIVLLEKFNFMTKFYLGIGCGFDNMVFESFRKVSNGSSICYSTVAQRQHFMCCLARSQKDIVGPKRTYERSKQRRSQAIKLGAQRLVDVLLQQVHTSSESQQPFSPICVNFNEEFFGDLAVVPMLKRPRALFTK